MNLSSISEELKRCDVNDISSIARVAIVLARQIQVRAKELQTPAERRQQAELDRMVQHPRDKATLTQMTDQAFRSHRAARAADQLAHILDVQGIPRFFSPLDRTMLRGFQSFGGYLPGVAVPLVKEKMRHETANVILPAEPELLSEHLHQRITEGIRMNVNLLGEAILGEGEAEQRLAAYLAALQMPEIECVSIKVSTLYSQISTVARSATVKLLSKRLELLYRAASRHRFKKADGTELPKFVYLDMEEYRDMELTGEVFMKTLDQPEMQHVRAGIALQAYIPDSHSLQRRLTEWARHRVAAGGAPVTVRIVKGANMEMERVEASHRGWSQAPYQKKIDTDANYKRMVVYGLKPQNIAAVKLGIASHNLFEVAFSIILAAKHGVLDQIQFEMLEGMANHQRRALHELVDNLLLYAPACQKENFINAIGYLVRRMDENTGPENFLRHAFKIEVDGPDWRAMEKIFLDSVAHMATVSDQPRRQQSRLEKPAQPAAPTDWRLLVNEPDTDFTLPSAATWAQTIVQAWKDRCDSNAANLLHSIGSGDEAGSGESCESLDPSRPGVVVAKFNMASPEQLTKALQCASDDPAGWRRTSPSERYELLRKVAQKIRERRADLMGAAMADAGKTLLESDPEVSEAIDFAEFYAKTALEIQQQPNMGSSPLGVVVVISPWNFPIAIPFGGVAAALAAGNTVILKPATETALVARVLCECIWDAGVPRQAVQLVICDGPDASKYLLSSPNVAACVFTGGTETAKRILAGRPDLRLFAETGGKNATIVSSLSDRDLAIKNVLHSAFSHAGQKCSATSLLLLEDEVFHDKQFRDLFIDAVSSMRVGSAWDLRTKMGPLVRPPQGALLRGLTELEPKERWALMPKNLDDNPCIYSPGVKWDVGPGSFTHLTELFGPVLGVMRYQSLEEAIDLVHQTGYGLTSGLESLDDREQTYWASRLQAGNLYINRSTTGAIVLRQPFGGMGKSAFGPGIKAGGPNYVVPLMTFEAAETQMSEPTEGDSIEVAPSIDPLAEFWSVLQSDHPAAVQLQAELGDRGMQMLALAIDDYDKFASDEIRQSHDTLRLVGQDNIRRYLNIPRLRIRLHEKDDWLDILARAIAVVAVGGRAAISQPPQVHTSKVDLLEALTDIWAGDLEFIEESDSELIEAIRDGEIDRLRYASRDRVSEQIRKAATDQFVYIADTPVTRLGRVELLWYVREQSLCVDYHRYGNLGFRAEEERQPVA
jgi:RHH-type transcriptional regulator, proline utilization regulon repressor / proline dehydrogenase / delta 1-pyrroline-5-carboxylate dehydrogenase